MGAILAFGAGEASAACHPPVVLQLGPPASNQEQETFGYRCDQSPPPATPSRYRMSGRAVVQIGTATGDVEKQSFGVPVTLDPN